MGTFSLRGDTLGHNPYKLLRINLKSVYMQEKGNPALFFSVWTDKKNSPKHFTNVGNPATVLKPSEV